MDATEVDRQATLLITAPGADDERSDWTGEELEADEAAQIEVVTRGAESAAPRDEVATALWRGEQALLDRMEEIADATRHLPDHKMLRLLDWIRENQCPGLPQFGRRAKGPAPAWNERRVLIFTENREGTKRYLESILEQAIVGPTGRTSGSP